MSEEKVVSILTLAGEFKSHSELHEYSNKQYIALDKATKRIKTLEGEIEHLKELLSATTQLLPKEPHKIIISPEEALCIGQISILEERGRMSELTLEDTKKLDLLIKNLNVIRNNQPKTFDGKTLDTVYTNTQLLSIASQDKQDVP